MVNILGELFRQHVANLSESDATIRDHKERGAHEIQVP